MRPSAVVAVAMLVAMPWLSPSAGRAQEAKLDVKSADTVKDVLARQMGKRVAVVLTTGPELAGVVTTVGDHVVVLSQLSGREYSDAVVTLDRIGAVVVRVRGQ